MATTYPNYLPFNDDTNYAAVEITVKRMYSDLLHQKGCCASKKVEKVLCQVDGILQAMQIDFDADDTVRYEDDVRSAYVLLSPFFNLA